MGRLQIQRRERASQFPFIQHNRPTLKHWLVFDIDCDDAFFRPEERGLPCPNFTAINRDNGHAHVGYQIDPPVSFYDCSSRAAIRYLDSVSSGLTHRLGADKSYAGFLSKNPLHNRWETAWQAPEPYTLGRLNDYLESSDKKHLRTENDSGLGRNVTVFDGIRRIGYREVLRFKKAHKTEHDLMEFLRKEAESINCTFPTKLSQAEIKCLARSVSKFCWGEFTAEKFSAIASFRAKKRWEKHPEQRSKKPWVEAGVSRMTWWRWNGPAKTQ